MNAAYIVGPAIGGILSRVNNRFPLYVRSFSLTQLRRGHRLRRRPAGGPSVPGRE